MRDRRKLTQAELRKLEDANLEARARPELPDPDDQETRRLRLLESEPIPEGLLWQGYRNMPTDGRKEDDDGIVRLRDTDDD